MLKAEEDDRIYDASFGIDPILVHLHKEYSDPKKTTPRQILISINTCIRNALNKDLTVEQNVQKVQHEMKTIVSVLSEVMGTGAITFYYTDYMKEYPKDRLRPVTPGRVQYHELCDTINKDLVEESGYMDQVSIQTVRLKHPYDKHLYGILKDVSKKVPSLSYDSKYYLISHLALDLHLLNLAPYGVLIQSHTGEPLTKQQLGEKVFGAPVPFTSTTHELLGDKNQIVSPLSIKQRKAVREIAVKERWHLMTDGQIRASVRKLGIFIK